MDELEVALEGSDYYEPVHSVKSGMDNPQLFDYETAVNRYYFSRLWETINDIGDKNDRKTLLDAYGREIDLMNIVWIYRAKTYYSMDTNSIYKFIIPVCHELNKRDMARMVAANNTSELMSVIATTKYAKIIDVQNPHTLETTYRGNVTKLNAKIRRDHPYSFAVINSYIFDKKTEVDRIVRIAESVRYGYDPKTIVNALNIRGNS